MPTAILIRHADVDADGTDPELNAAGNARARELVHMLGDAGIVAILVTSLRRSRQTAAPLAAALSIDPIQADEVAEVVAAIRGQQQDAAVLVVGHTNTVPEIIAALGGPTGVTIAADEFDRMFVLSHGHLTRLRYGAKACPGE
jgi:broad specificity phosphatase PhoE